MWAEILIASGFYDCEENLGALMTRCYMDMGFILCVYGQDKDIGLTYLKAAKLYITFKFPWSFELTHVYMLATTEHLSLVFLIFIVSERKKMGTDVLEIPIIEIFSYRRICIL